MLVKFLINFTNQYTVVDEASRERFIYPYKEHSSHSTVDFIKRAIVYFGYTPEIIQTDNGAEFTHIRNTQKIHSFDVLCNELSITHQLICLEHQDIMVKRKEAIETIMNAFIVIYYSIHSMT